MHQDVSELIFGILPVTANPYHWVNSGIIEDIGIKIAKEFETVSYFKCWNWQYSVEITLVIVTECSS